MCSKKWEFQEASLPETSRTSWYSGWMFGRRSVRFMLWGKVRDLRFDLLQSKVTERETRIVCKGSCSRITWQETAVQIHIVRDRHRAVLPVSRLSIVFSFFKTFILEMVREYFWGIIFHGKMTKLMIRKCSVFDFCDEVRVLKFVTYLSAVVHLFQIFNNWYKATH